MEADCNSFFTAGPVTGDPWIGAFLGAKGKAANISFVTESVFNDVAVNIVAKDAKEANELTGYMNSRAGR